jgi:hypothetical protein
LRRASPGQPLQSERALNNNHYMARRIYNRPHKQEVVVNTLENNNSTIRIMVIQYMNNEDLSSPCIKTPRIGKEILPTKR